MGDCTFEFDPGDAGTLDGVDGRWDCPHEAHPDADRCVFHLGDGERADLGIDSGAVTERLLSLLESENPEQKRVLGADLPTIDLAYRRVAGRTRTPLDLRYSDVDGIAADHATVDQPIELGGATVGPLSLDDAEFEKGLHAEGVTVEGPIDAHECVFAGDVRFEGATFEAAAGFDEAEFDDDVSFDDVAFQAGASFEGATFEYAAFENADFDEEATFQDVTFDGDIAFDDTTFGALADFDEARFRKDSSFARTEYHGLADFRGIEFEGGANVLEDDADFEEAVFHGDARFGHAEFVFADFRGVDFEGEATFQDVTFGDDVTFDDATFRGLADFDEARFQEDSSFVRTEYHDTADFRGIEFAGGANVLEDDLTFEGSTFHDVARFGRAEFAFANFGGVTFEEDATFEEAVFDEDVDFTGARFRALADFDEARFYADGDFTDVTYEARADFRGTEFLGEARHLRDNARFEDATFRGRAEFDNAAFTTANFRGTTFADTVDFQSVEFRDRVEMAAASGDGEIYVNMTGADLAGGEIRQPDDHWVYYDLTRAHLGEVSLSGGGDDRELFDYFGFLETDFDGFDFSAHRGSLERNDWALHEFEGSSPDYEFALAATPAAIETTYLYAYNNAKAMGDSDTATEFAIHQAKFRRKKNLDYVRDGSLSPGYRLGKVGDVVGNVLWHQVCGYGYRLWRILAVSVGVILTWALLYASPIPGTETNAPQLASFGDLLTADGLVIFSENVYYSVITFTTVGYGNIGPQGQLSGILAGTEAVLGVLLAALVVFVLGRRVAV